MPWPACWSGDVWEQGTLWGVYEFKYLVSVLIHEEDILC
jgi:hypothetical protein